MYKKEMSINAVKNRYTLLNETHWHMDFWMAYFGEAKEVEDEVFEKTTGCCFFVSYPIRNDGDGRRSER